MKSLRNKVILSGIVLLFAFIATIGSTYAWFTVSQATSVDSINLSVTSANNLLVRFRGYNGTSFDTYTTEELNDLSDYSATLDNTDFTGAGYSLGYKLQPTTIIDPGYTTVTPTSLSYIGDLENVDRALLPATRNGVSGHYVEIQLYLYSQAESAQIIEMSTLAIQATTANNNTTGQNNIQDATRLIVFPGSVQDTNAGTAQIYGHDADYNFAFVENQGGYLTSIGTLATTDPFNALSNLDNYATLSGLLPTPTDLATYSASANNVDLLTIQPNTPTLVSVYIYIEGWDIDADNLIVEAEFNFAFGFKFGTA